MIHDALVPESSWPVVVLMATKEMLRFGYQLGQGLKAVGHGSIAFVKPLKNKGRFNLGYKPIHEELFQASRSKKRKCITLGMAIPHIITTFLAPAEVIMLDPFKELKDKELDLACIIQFCPKCSP